MTRDKKARRPRGSFPPSLSLGDAVSIITRLHEDVGGDASYDTFGNVINNSPSSSTFNRKLGTLKNYGLIADENKHVVVSPLGYSVVAPTSLNERAEALKEAFTNIEVFAALYDKYLGKLLPQDEFLINVIAGLVPKEFANTWLDRFKHSGKAAGLIQDRGDGKLQVRGMAETERPSAVFTDAIRAEEQPTASSSARSQTEEGDQLVGVSFGHVSKIKLSEHRQAVFSLPDRLTPRDAQKLKGALQGLAAIIDSMVDEGNDAASED